MDGTSLIHDKVGQKWYYNFDDMTIINSADNKVMEIADWALLPGTPVQLNANSGGANQRFCVQSKQ